MDTVMEQLAPLAVKFKPLYEDTVLPYYATEDSAGLDCTVHENGVVNDGTTYQCKLGFAVEIPKGYVGLLFPRSSIKDRINLLMSNSVGVIDSDYRGEVMAHFATTGQLPYNVGERCCQLIIIPYPKIQVIQADELSTTARGENGHGSTGL